MVTTLGNAEAYADRVIEHATDDGTPAEVVEWIQGSDTTPGLKQILNEAMWAVDGLSRDSDETAIARAKDHIHKVKTELLRGRQQGFLPEYSEFRDTRFNDDEDTPPNYADDLARNMAYFSADTKKLAVAEYRRQILYDALYPQIEEICEYFVKLTTLEPRGYALAWQTYLMEQGIQPSEYDPYLPGSQFVENVYQFFLLHGTSSLEEANPELGAPLNNKMQEDTNDAFPDRPKSDRSGMDIGMFPDDTAQIYPDGSFDRILASWSFSTRMLAEMSVEEMATKVWPEVDRLLAPGGIAVIFPIGRYASQDLEGYSCEEFRIEASLRQYLQAHTGLTFEIEGSWDPNMGGDGVLTIRKA